MKAAKLNAKNEKKGMLSLGNIRVEFVIRNISVFTEKL